MIYIVIIIKQQSILYFGDCVRRTPEMRRFPMEDLCCQEAAWGLCEKQIRLADLVPAHSGCCFWLKDAVWNIRLLLT